MLVDLKSIEDLEKLRGVEGPRAGLGTDAKRGLCGLGRDHGYKAVELEGEHHHHMNAPKRRSTGDSGGGRGGRGGDAHSASLDMRRCVDGVNALPPRPSKTLLQLTWLAFKDKVLFMLTAAAVVSLALGLSGLRYCLSNFQFR